MKAMLLRQPAPADKAPLELTDIPRPEPGVSEVLVRVRACGVCHTDLHVVEGELPAHLPIVPGHQVTGVVEATGERVGIPWLHRTCGRCEYCRSGRENLCDVARFTGFHVNGGFAEYAIVPADYVVKIPDGYDDAHAAPLLCAGIVGYRALRQSGIQAGQKLGLYGFGASAHLVIQVAAHWGCEILVATRSAAHQKLARELGAGWVGRAEELPAAELDAAIMFAPAGTLVPEALRALRKGGTLALAGIYMTPIPKLDYDRLYHERVVRSVANATRQDARDFMAIAGEVQLRTEVTEFRLAEANRALQDVKHSKLPGAAVLRIA